MLEFSEIWICYRRDDKELFLWSNCFDPSYGNGVLVLITTVQFSAGLETGLVFQTSGTMALLDVSEMWICYRY